MRPERWPTWLDHLWAKSPVKGADLGETLAQHTWDTVSRLADMARLRPGLPAQLGMLRLWHVAFWAAFLHDFGKAASGFQSVLRGGERWPYRHEVLSLAFVDDVSTVVELDEVPWLVAMVVSHHKDAQEIIEQYCPQYDFFGGAPAADDVDLLVQQLSAEDAVGLRRWITECSGGWISALGLQELGVQPLPPDSTGVDRAPGELTAGIHRCLGAYEELIRSGDFGWPTRQALVGIALRGHMTNADYSASAHAGSFPQPSITADRVMEALRRPAGVQPVTLAPHQVQAGATGGSAILTAPTGSGKTEAGLLWAAAQWADAGGPSRLFYTLPYQASMNAMKRRLDRTYGTGQVGLIHGRSLLSLYNQLAEGEYDPKSVARQARQARDLARLNYPPVRVLSPYQILKAMYRLKGYEAQLSDYFRATFIFDELHAYDPGRLGMILSTMGYLARDYEARFLVMTATLPTLVRQRLAQALGDVAEIVAAPEVFAQFRRHRVHLLEGELLEPEALDRMAAEARAGQAVLVLCNVVARAQEAYRQLQERLADSRVTVELLHGRFNLRDRLLKEEQARARLSTGGAVRQPMVLVATQVVEVSLDLDFDTTYSDPAPLEALVQRFGRVNRRKRMDLAPVHVFREPTDGQGIYSEALVTGTLAVLAELEGQPLDESQVGRLIDRTYEGPAAEEWAEEYEHSRQQFEMSCIQDMQPFASNPELEEVFYKAFDSIEVLPADLNDEYAQLKDEEPLRSGQLLVPISWRRYGMLRREGLAQPGAKGEPATVFVAYDSESGLQFDRALVPINEDDMF